MKTVKKAQSGTPPKGERMRANKNAAVEANKKLKAEKKNTGKELGGEKGRPPFPEGRKGMPYEAPTMGGAKSGAKVKKARSGGSYAAAGKSTGHTGSGMLAPTEKNLGKTRKQAKFQDGGSLGMKSVKAGVDKNPSVTRADIITAGKQNAGKAKSGKKMKSGGMAKKCRGGC